MAVIVIMGVAGSGKTTIGKTLANVLNQQGEKFTFHDADDFHSYANRAKMAAGQPLNDEDRSSWLDSLASLIEKAISNQQQIILACSALKQRYRESLLAKVPKIGSLLAEKADNGSNYDARRIKWFYLKAPKQLIVSRLQGRQNHYFKADLIDSQFEALEEPDEQTVVHLDASKSVQVIVRDIEKVL